MELVRAARAEANEAVLATMRTAGTNWWAAMPLSATCKMLSSDPRIRRIIVDHALRRLKYAGLVESSGTGLWRAKP